MIAYKFQVCESLDRRSGRGRGQHKTIAIAACLCHEGWIYDMNKEIRSINRILFNSLLRYCEAEDPGPGDTKMD
eukprot:scaffold4781_cov103-Skeletonema_dohrnii-CCMP3373.AAC.3